MKALQILNAMPKDNGYINIIDIVSRTDLSPSTVHRILKELVECDYIEKDEIQKQYRIGREMIILANGFNNNNNLVILAKNELTRLNSISNETIHLVMLDGMEGVYIDKIDTKHEIRLKSKIGNKIPLYCTGAGKAILAFQNEKWQNKYIASQPRVKHTSKTIVDEDALRTELKNIQSKGYSTDNQEHHDHVRCISIPIITSSQEAVAAISISAPEFRFTDQDALALVGELRKSAEIIEKGLNPFINKYL